jgi:alkylation response protein AidB-like acyl-CoA dehydrogenase
MDFDLTEEQRIFRDRFRSFCEKEIAPLVKEAEEKEEFPVQLFPRMGELGYLGLTYPAEYGAAGADTVTFCLYAHELGRVCSGMAGSLVVHSSVATHPIHLLGTEEQRRKYLVPAIRGEKVFAFGLTEPNAGSDAGAIRTSAKKHGDNYIINGTKILITNARISDAVMLAAQTNPSMGLDGISLFVVEKGTPGFKVGRKIKKMGNRSSDLGELIFEDAVVPAANRLGPERGGFKILMDALNGGRMVVAARAMGIAEAAYEASLKYSKERVQFGKSIGSFQAIGFKLARMATLLSASRLLILQSAWLKDRGMDHASEASMAKLFATEAAQEITYEAVQIHGGYGYTDEFPVERYFRDARAMTIVEGTSEIQHQIISRRL